MKKGGKSVTNEELLGILIHKNHLKKVKIKVGGVVATIKSVYFDKDKNIIISDKKNERDIW